ncbi:PadR family transcriptional regulator [Sporosarcina beigongshangi]|uniref:PadR family transcriptional regulator n=1 Tax=Sporosarcina beigongshangi TaxID=2782538 RepID=UPI00193A5769|nr:PadR family transcriptional regulator [Sporosarcina beigongshangi]
MENRLKGLKKSMDDTAFSQLQFTEQHRKEIRAKISETDDSVLLAVMQLLVEEKTGYELVQFLGGRGIRKFEDNEGNLYTLLHQLERDGCLQSSWNEATKFYRLNNKGIKRLGKMEKQSSSRRFTLKDIVEG